MDFNGTWQVYAQENIEEFLKALGKGWKDKEIFTGQFLYSMWLDKNTCAMHTELPPEVIKMAKDIKPITEIKQSGNDFTVTSKTPGKTVTNSFTIGKEADITTMDGKIIKVCLFDWSLFCSWDSFMKFWCAFCDNYDPVKGVKTSISVIMKCMWVFFVS